MKMDRDLYDQLNGFFCIRINEKEELASASPTRELSHNTTTGVL